MENINEYTPYENPFEEKKRPGFLTFLCILTFIGSGFSLLSNLLMPIIAPIGLEFLQGSSLGDTPGVIEQYEQMVATPVWKFYLTAIFCATSVLGAVYMLKMKRIGFHLYAVAQFAILAVSQFLFGGNLQPKISDLIITLLFIGLYAIYYKKYTGLESEQAEQLEE
jgi:hypothetical protein